MLAALATDDQKPSGGTQRPGKGLGRGRQLIGGLRFSLREGMGKNTWDMAHSETTDLVVLTLPMIDFGVKNFKPLPSRFHHALLYGCLVMPSKQASSFFH